MRAMLVVFGMVAVLACGGGAPAGEAQARAADGTDSALSSDCTGLMPADADLQRSFSVTMLIGRIGGSCIGATSDGAGNVLFGTNHTDYASYDRWEVHDSAGAQLGNFSFRSDLYTNETHVSVVPMQQGAIALTGGNTCSFSTSECRDSVSLKAYSPSGAVINETQLIDLANQKPDKAWSLASDPTGGVLLAHASAPGDGTWTITAQRFDETARPLTGANVIWSGTAADWPNRVVAGVALDGRALVLWVYQGSLSGVWIDRSGNRISGLVSLNRSFDSSDKIGLDRLLDGSLVLQQGPWLGTAAWQERFVPGSTAVSSAPAWLATRPNTRLSIVRGRRGYLLAFPNTTGQSCAPQHYAIFAPSGARCGGFDLEPNGPGSCADSVVGGSGRDGTVWAAAMAITDPNGSPGCQFRAWPGLLR